MLKLHNVCKTYGTYQAVDNVSLELQKGEVHGIVGSSGAGKSTLLRIMNLLEVPDTSDAAVVRRLFRYIRITIRRGCPRNTPTI